MVGLMEWRGVFSVLGAKSIGEWTVALMMIFWEAKWGNKIGNR